MAGRPTTFFLHAVGFTGESLSPVASRVDGDSVCLDVIGHGRSVAPRGYVYSARDAAERFLGEVAVHDAVASPRFGFGHSGGGTVLLWAELLAPGTFDALFLYEPPVRVLPPDPAVVNSPVSLAESVKYRRNSFVDHSEFASYLRERTPYRDFDPEAFDAYVHSGLVAAADGSLALACHPEFEASIYGTPDSELVERLGELQLDVTIARGELTNKRFTKTTEVLAERLPSSSLVTLADLSHFGPLESPAEVAAIFSREVFAERGVGIDVENKVRS